MNLDALVCAMRQNETVTHVLLFSREIHLLPTQASDVDLQRRSGAA